MRNENIVRRVGGRGGCRRSHRDETVVVVRASKLGLGRGGGGDELIWHTENRRSGIMRPSRMVAMVVRARSWRTIRHTRAPVGCATFPASRRRMVPGYQRLSGSSTLR